MAVAVIDPVTDVAVAVEELVQRLADEAAARQMRPAEIVEEVEWDDLEASVVRTLARYGLREWIGARQHIDRRDMATESRRTPAVVGRDSGAWKVLSSVTWTAHGSPRRLIDFGILDCEELAGTALSMREAWARRRVWAVTAKAALEEKKVATVGQLPPDILRSLEGDAAKAWSR